MLWEGYGALIVMNPIARLMVLYNIVDLLCTLWENQGFKIALVLAHEELWLIYKYSETWTSCSLNVRFP
jgi:hypothetical protein